VRVRKADRLRLVNLPREPKVAPAAAAEAQQQTETK